MEQTIDFSVSTQLIQLINAEMAFNYRIFPYKETEECLFFYADEETWKANYKSELSLVLGKKVEISLIASQKLEKGLITNYRKVSNQNQSQQKAESINVENDFLEGIITEAKNILSSDIHFEVFEEDARIRYRIDGKLIEKYKIEKENYLELVNKIKIKSNLDITEKRLPQDGRIRFDGTNIRVSILPTLYGEKMVMRLLGTDTSHLGIDKLGMSPDEVKQYLEALKASKGIILISGPTGSGKTTTLYASLKLLNKISTNIVTVEDPIEYTLDGVNQVQLKEDIGLTFASVLRTFLRQDPDIIMLGEIRDKSTAEMAIRASLTGHLVLSTIHTNSALGTISRLVDMGVPSFLIAETLKISVAQRLVRKLCVNCKEQVTFDSQEYENKKLKGITSHYKPKGCSNCYYTGYTGRQAIYDLITNDSELSNQIKNNTIESNINSDKLSGLGEKALDLVKKGVTSIEEVYSIISEA